MNLLTNDEVEKSIQHLSQIKQLMRDGKVAKSEKDVKSGLPKLVFTERTADELLQAMLTIKHHKSKVEEMQKTLEELDLTITKKSNMYADGGHYNLSQDLDDISESIENILKALKGETK